MPTNPFIDIVIPLYNEEEIIAESVTKLLDFLNKSAFPYKYIVTLTNNASTDKTKEIIEKLAGEHPEVRVINLDKKGKGFAIRTAWSRSEGEILTFMDADLSSDLQFFQPLVEAVVSRRCDLAIGNRLGKNSKVYSRKIIRKLASRVFNMIARTILKTKVADHQCGFKAIRADTFRKIAPLLLEDSWFIDTELIAVALHNGFRVIPIDIVWSDSITSKVALVKDSKRMFADLFRLHNRLKNKS